MDIKYQQEAAPDISLGQVNLLSELRFLWLRTAMWMRSYIHSISAGYAGTEAIGRRVYRAALDFYPALVTFLGEENARNIINLMSGILMDLMRITEEMHKGDESAVNRLVTDIYGKADLLAESLAGVNPYWTEQQWKALFYNYISTTLSEMVALLSLEFERGISIYDRLELQTMTIADYMMRGLMYYLFLQDNPVN